MKIAVDLRPLLTSHPSGVTVYIRGMLKALQEQPGLELDLFYFASKAFPPLHEEFPTLRFLAISSSRFYSKFLFKVPRLPKDFFVQTPDLIWLPDRRPFFKTEIPIVMTIHDLVPESMPETLSAKAWAWHLFFPLNKLLKHCSGVLSPSSSALRKKQFSLSQAITYAGVSLVEAEQAKLKIKKNYFLFIAPADPRKNIDLLVQAALAFPKQDFIWLGAKEGETRFKKIAAKLPKNVHSIGEVSEAEKAYWIKNALALLALSKEEGFDLPVLEAITLKTSVLLSDIPVHHELYTCKYPLIKNIDDLKLSIQRILNGEKILPKPRGDYTWENAARLSLRFFSRIIADKNRNRGADRNR